jgi:hypothetical protein
MRFKLDENLSPLLAALFSAAGHEAHSVTEQALLAFLSQEQLKGALWIVEDDRIRIHE